METIIKFTMMEKERLEVEIRQEVEDSIVGQDLRAFSAYNLASQFFSEECSRTSLINDAPL